jgi:uncharacterized protein
MKKFLLALIMILCVATLGYAQDYTTLGMSTGGMSGTYYPFGKDIQRVCGGKLNINVMESAGSLSNIERIFSDPNVQFAIVQTDALMYKANLDPGMTNKIRMVFPLYNEEIHVVVRSDSGITKIEDLAGRKVAIGANGSGNWVTGQVMKAKTNINWLPVELSPKDGMEALSRGEIAAVIGVGGKPMGLFRDLSNASGKIKLINVKHPGLDATYIQTTIPEGIYSWQTVPVSTYAVKSILATFQYREGGTRSQQIEIMVKAIMDNLDNLQSGQGHPKWREVDPWDLTRVKWPVHTGAAKVIRSYKQ